MVTFLGTNILKIMFTPPSLGEIRGVLPLYQYILDITGRSG